MNFSSFSSLLLLIYSTTAIDVDGESSGNDDNTSVQVNVSKSRGKRRAILLSDLDDQDLESHEKLSASRAVYLPFRWVLSAMWLCKSGHFHSCCPSPVLDILLEIS